MKKTIMIIVLVLVCVLCLSGCEIQLGGGGKTAIQMSGETGDVEGLPDTVTAPVGSTFAFSLEGNATTGYTWQVMIEDEEIVELKSNEYVPEDSEVTGSGGIATLTFGALKKGETKLTLEYAQDWEGGEVDKTKEITVVVE